MYSGQPVVPANAPSGGRSDSPVDSPTRPSTKSAQRPRFSSLFRGARSTTTTSEGPRRSSARKSDVNRKTARSARSRAISCARCLVESNFTTALTTLLTIYALLGDDVRLMATDEPADVVFDSITCCCLVIFTIEIFLSILGKDDYFMSFFMILDAVSTSTLVLDLTWVNNMILGDEEDMTDMSGSRTAKIGARMTRIIRVMRLVRILKLYKAIYEARMAKKRKEARKNNPGEDDDDWDDDYEVDPKFGANRESLVGKKLSDITTRSVIILVITMMLLARLVRIDTSQQLPTSATYGADVVSHAFRAYLESGTEETKYEYETAILQYLYWHNWYTGHQDCAFDVGCPANYDSHAFWVGIVSDSEITVEEISSQASLRSDVVNSWVADVAERESSADTTWLFSYGSMPDSVVTTLGQPWSQRCDTRSGATHRIGISLIGKEMPEWENPVAVKCPEDLRRGERSKYYATVRVNEASLKEWHLGIYFDLRPFTFWEAFFSLMVTFGVCILLCIASACFSKDADRLVLTPVENMIAKVETIRENPLAATKVADEEFHREEVSRARTKKLRESKNILNTMKDLMLCKGSAGPAELMETVILEKTIIKLGSLLALGFGEAGSQIIEHNMNGVDSACVDAMIEGTRVECIIGATRIRNFGTATEVLQGKVMTFVNQIAEIVHGVVDEFHGYASKNNGDFFMMIWRKSANHDGVVLSKLADMSMLAFARILGAVHRSPVLAAYRGHPGLQQRLGKNCRVHLSSGLHYGWAIEGAVGSEFKIDASYLSPNVSIAETVERATKIYGVSILVAESVVKVCSPEIAAKCRLIDRVLVTGSVSPMELYSIDLDYMSLTVESSPPMHINWTARQRFRVRQFLETEKKNKLREDEKMVRFFEKNSEIAAMRYRYTLEFIHVFNMGYQNYSQGEWQVAQRLLTRTRTMLGVVDGPSLALLQFMEHQPTPFEAPKVWQGVRELSHAMLQ